MPFIVSLGKKGVKDLNLLFLAQILVFDSKVNSGLDSNVEIPDAICC